MNFSKLRTLLNTPKSISIIPHKNPDGDAIGSVLACYQYLTQLKHNTNIISPNNFPDFLKWLPSTNEILMFDSQTEDCTNIIHKSDIIFLMDFNDLSRVGTPLQEVLESYKGTFVMIDHHQQPSDIAHFLYSNTKICATAQMFYHFLEELNHLDLINENIATCLYTGIMTDTGSFKYRTTTSKTHKIIANLIDNGADNTFIHRKVFDENSYNRLQLLGRALQNLVHVKEQATAYITLSESDKKEFNFKKGDSEGIVNYALSIKDVNFGAIFIEDKEQGIIKISFRSKGTFSVNKFARKHFSGGGHINAAGGKSDLSISETIKHFLRVLPDYHKEIINSSNL